MEETARAMGITYAGRRRLKVGEKERSRDEHRWELDPASSEDYQERIERTRSRWRGSPRVADSRREENEDEA